MPVDKDQHILKDELIRLTGKKGVEEGKDQVILRRILVYESDKDVPLEMITQQLECQHPLLQLYIKPDGMWKFFSNN